MATRKSQKHLGKGPSSPKDHRPMPPRSIEPEVEPQRDTRGEAGQYTGEGAPGLQKK